MCDTQPPPRTRPSTGEARRVEEGDSPLLTDSTSCTSATELTRQKHPYGRRNTLVRSYTRHGLGFATADRDESLTVTKFRDLPSRERRLYTLTMGYGLRADNKSGFSGDCKRQRQQSGMSKGHAVALMARLHEMLRHDGRTVEGVFSALGVDESRVNKEQYASGLEHMAVRAGTAIPTGAAEQSLASLYRQREEAWPFLAQQLTNADAEDSKEKDTPNNGTQLKEEAGATKPDEVVTSQSVESANVNSQRGEFGGAQVEQQQQQHSSGQEDRKRNSTVAGGEGDGETFSLARLSAALEAFARARDDRGYPLDGLAIQDLVAFLYLGGHARQMTLAELQAIVMKYGRWAIERARREAKGQKAKLVEATKNGNNNATDAVEEENAVDGESGDGDSEGKGEGAGEGNEPSPGTGKQADRETAAALQGQPQQEDSSREEMPLFSLQEAEFMIAFLMESQQAFSLINVADIQRGIRAAKRAEAQAASREVYRRAAERFAAELLGAGMALDSDDGWERWFDMCELGLRAGAAGNKRLVGRTELRRGLKALSAAPKVPEVPPPLPVEAVEGETNSGNGDKEGDRQGRGATADSSEQRRGGTWSEQDIDDLLGGVTILGGGGSGGFDGGEDANGTGRGGGIAGKDGTAAADFTDVEFREHLLLAITEGAVRADRDMAVADKVLPLTERLQAYLKDHGIRLGQFFERVVAWARQASEEDLIMQWTDRVPPPGAGAAAGAAQRGDDSCVAPAALKAVLVSLTTGGLTGAERAKLKADELSAVKEEQERKAAEGVSAEAAKRVLEAEKSGASVILDLIRASVASKSIRVIELFNTMDTSKDGLISREELREGLAMIAEGHLGQSASMEQMREVCRNRRRSAAIRENQDKELRRALKLRARIAAAQASGAAKVLRRIHEHLVQTRHKVVDMFRSFSLRGHLSLTTAELEMALSLVDGLELTRREVRSVVRFLDKDSSGTIDVAEIDEAVREFRELTLDMPSLGTGPMTVIDAAEIGRLARRTFDDIVVNNAPPSSSSRIDNDNNTRSGGSNDGDDDDKGEHQATVRVSDVSAAFEEAFRQFKADGEGQHSIAAMRHPGIQQPSTDTQHAQACVDKVMEWLRNSRTFDRAPTGRVPTLAEQMTERQKMEVELQNKLQEKRRRAAGQKHWEEWVSRKARRSKSGAAVNGDDNDRQRGGVDAGIGGESAAGEAAARRRREQRERQEDEDRRRKKEQDEAFAAWAREKDKVLRARKREKRREMTSGGLDTLEAINKKLRGARCATPSRLLPRLGCRSDGGSLTSVVQTSGEGGGSRLGMSKDVGSIRGKRRRPATKAERKALDLAVTRVAVSPYRVPAKDKYQHSKHIEGGKIVTRMARNQSKPFPKALVEEGWQATSQLLGSAGMSLIDHPTAKHGAVAARNADGSNGSKKDEHGPTGHHVFVGNHSSITSHRSSRGNRTTSTARGEQSLRSARRKRGEQRPLDSPVAPAAVADVSLLRPEKLSDTPASSSSSGSGRNSVVFLAPSCEAGSAVRPASVSDRQSRVDAKDSDGIEEGRQTWLGVRGTGGRAEDGNNSGEDAQNSGGTAAAAVAAVGARPEGRRGNSRGAPEGTGCGDGLDGVAKEGGGGGRRRGSSNSEDMEFPIQSQELPDWADTIKDLPVDDPYQEGEDDFEPDDDSIPPPSES
ncbi:hypothetical protein Esi_0082_0041 [Ectocarpus siliculosus]|uniref:EF-hand domain-containing protein n=1 Tax=Ectocarpus siliculosus TaxID=2880 RepID=D8LTI5_ECTSI|nr:hypothetical protein Esi_0082_0041 [Ectocarpus siliculosus]|eukprot:CBN78026.1 hypothetical protein Esi_0082_0041 [Ectocarpus siliculosus]